MLGSIKGLLQRCSRICTSATLDAIDLRLLQLLKCGTAPQRLAIGKPLCVRVVVGSLQVLVSIYF